jgi:hypothetical protein
MPAAQPNSATGLPYSLVDIDEPKRPLKARLTDADSFQLKLWLLKYAWILSIITMAPGIALAAFLVTHNLAFALTVTATAVLTSGGVFWWRTRQLP